MDSFTKTDGPGWLKFDNWQLFVEGEVEHEGASPSVRPE